MDFSKNSLRVSSYNCFMDCSRIPEESSGEVLGEISEGVLEAVPSGTNEEVPGESSEISLELLFFLKFLQECI